ncbi:uncharacterized protein EMH_0043490 [Eimeria mitis]|uniref:Transmembrane protein n=1 Tax=Eimeria mitis TaxID=44415 RepID=U6JYX8_9EIME|nr:uncharacterized protein EMH_0043490 [Eimeria mitis]CDJ28728.1 hypothetical protein, conserved [Eimeria mitis]
MAARSVVLFVFVCLPVFLLGPVGEQQEWQLPSVQMAAARRSSPPRPILSPSSSEEQLFSPEPSEEGEGERARKRTKSSSSTGRRSGVFEWPVESMQQPEQPRPEQPKEPKPQKFSTQKEEEELVRTELGETAQAAAAAAEAGVLQTLRNIFTPQLASAQTLTVGVPGKLLRLGRKRESNVSEADVVLSPDGESQAKKLDLKLYNLIEAINECEMQKLNRAVPSFCLEAFVSSPHTCSIQTATLGTSASGKWFLCRGPKETVTRNTRPTWLLDPMIRDRTKTIATAGTETSALQTKLLDLHTKGSMGSAALDFDLLPAQDAWWLPYSTEQLQAILRGSPEKERPSSSSSTGSASGSNPFIVGDAEAWPHRIGATSLKATDERMQSSLQNRNGKGYLTLLGEKGLRTSYEGSLQNRSIPPPNSPLPKESLDVLQLRNEVFLRALCLAKNFSSGLFFSHPRFLSALLGSAKVKAGDINAAVLTCADGKGYLTVLGEKGLRTSYEAERKSSSSSEASDIEA